MRESERPVALVTGGAIRIGRAIALELAELGYSIVVHYRDSGDSAAALADAIRNRGGAAAAISGNLSRDDDVAMLVENAETALGPVRCLVNNASMFKADDLASLESARWDEQMAVNLKAPVFLAKAMAERLPAGAEGNVVNIIDQRVLSPTSDFFSYTLAKTALHTATRMLAIALAPSIRVNAVAPGPVLKSVHQGPEEFEAERKSTLLGRGASPEEIAAAVRFLVSAGAVTGQLLVVDGGQHLAAPKAQ